MKITVQTTTFSRELFKAQGIANAKSTLPVLQNILLEATADGRLTLKVTDLETSLSTEISGNDVQVHEPGRLTIRAKDLYETVKNLKGESLTLEKDDQHWGRLTSGTVRARFVGVNPDEYPAIPSVDTTEFAAIPTDRFIRAADLVYNAISKDPSRPHMCGAFFHVASSGKLGFVATDGHRLNQAVFDFSGDLPEEIKKGVIVPRKGIEDLRRSIDLTQETIGVALSGSTIVFKQQSSLLFVRLIDGNFPPYENVIPADVEENKAIIDRSMFLDRIKLVSIFCRQKSRSMRIALEDGVCIISAHDNETGECEERLPIAYSGPNIRAGFNHQYVQEVLSVLRGPEFSFEIKDALKPAIIHELDTKEDEDSVFVVMPMRL